MNKNNNKNKNMILKQLIKTIRTRSKRYNNNKVPRTYKYLIKSPLINYTTPDYTEQNLKFTLNLILQNTQVFNQLSQQYLQYRLKKVIFYAIPRVVNAIDPSPVWIYLDTNAENTSFNYVAIPQLQGSRSLPIKHVSLTTFRSTGRQVDFNYWHDIDDIDYDLAIRLRSEQEPNDRRYWQFQIGYQLEFRRMVMPIINNNNKNNVQKEQEVKIESDSYTANLEKGTSTKQQEIPNKKEDSIESVWAKCEEEVE